MSCTEPPHTRERKTRRIRRSLIERPLPRDFDDLPADEWDRLVRHIAVHGSISAVFKPC